MQGAEQYIGIIEGVSNVNVALILSGGTGIRMGSDIPKQYIEVCKKPIIFYSMECLTKHEGIDAVQIVAEPDWQEQIEKWLTEFGLWEKIRGFSNPGKNRQLSIFHGLTGIREYAGDSAHIFIHDAARPMLSRRQITDCLAGMAGHDGVIPVLPMKDTVYTSKNGRTITALLNRGEIYAGQAPEVFQLGKYYEANLRLMPERILGINGSTEPAVMAGLDIAMIPGDEGNFKITTRADLERFRRIMEAGEKTER